MIAANDTISYPLLAPSRAVVQPGRLGITPAVPVTIRQPDTRGTVRYLKLQNLGGAQIRFRVGPSQQPSKQARRGLFQRLFKFLSCVPAHEINHAVEFLKCPTKFVTGLTK